MLLPYKSSNSSNIVGTNSETVGLQMSEYVAKGDWRLFFLHRDQIRQARLEDMRRVAATYLKPSNRTIGIFLPASKPDRADIPSPRQ